MKIMRTTAIAISTLLAFAASAQGTIDNTFTVGAGASAGVVSSVMQNDGKVVISGAFVTYNGTARNRIARVLRDGSLDATFTPGSGANNNVNHVVLAPGGDMYIGGLFTSYDGTGRNRIARLNSDGSLDAGFAPGTGFNNAVIRLAVQSDGKVIAVGDFTSYNGTACNRIARLNPDGSLDGTFTPGTAANSRITSVVVQSDNKILIGGYFNDYNGTLVVALARLNSNGTLDTGYNAGGAGPDNSVEVIELQPDGKALVGGTFATYNGIARSRIFRANTNGSLDTGFNPGTGGNAGSIVLAFAQQSDGAVIVGGTFTTFDGVTHNRICRLGSNGAVDATWTSGATNFVYTLCWIPEGKVVVGGIFGNIAAASRTRLARLNALCKDNVNMVVKTDGAGSETTWQLRPYGYTYAAYSGSGLPDNATTSASGCLADGCYELIVQDGGSNGITNGGYLLKSQNGKRIIDDSLNFSSGALSQISGAQGGPVNFCIPISAQTPIYTSRDKVDWINNKYIVSSEDAAVSQVWTDFGSGSPERATSGYDFWFYNPNGGYSYVRSRRHSTSDGFAPANATRACHMKINNWAVANQIPANTLMNVRIRPVVIGTAGAWGPAHRFKIDALRASCPLTKLMDVPGNPYLSCGENRVFGPGNYVHARPVQGANKYQFRFQIPAESFSVTRTSNNYFVQLNWGVNPLQAGKTYQVDVRASFDGGTTWCSDFIPPALDPWGDVCLLTIVSSLQGGGQRMDMEDEEVMVEEPTSIRAWPNPNAGDLLNLHIAGIDQAVDQLSITVLDAMGRIVHQEQATVFAPLWNGAVAFDAPLPAGAYVVQVTAGEQRWVERWVVGE